MWDIRKRSSGSPSITKAENTIPRTIGNPTYGAKRQLTKVTLGLSTFFPSSTSPVEEYLAIAHRVHTGALFPQTINTLRP